MTEYKLVVDAVIESDAPLTEVKLEWLESEIIWHLIRDAEWVGARYGGTVSIKEVTDEESQESSGR